MQIFPLSGHLWGCLAILGPLLFNINLRICFMFHKKTWLEFLLEIHWFINYNGRQLTSFQVWNLCPLTRCIFLFIGFSLMSFRELEHLSHGCLALIWCDTFLGASTSPPGKSLQGRAPHTQRLPTCLQSWPVRVSFPLLCLPWEGLWVPGVPCSDVGIHHPSLWSGDWVCCLVC